ncbi:MAG: winged helix-turn-helix transcriptional regulator [Chloroflexi bacterium]|nr:winged helix-turn-helix transcriptional regulator [Chloroflexota bacterium]
MPSGEASSPPVGVAFLLAQFGAHAAEQFAARIAALGLTPPQVGLLRAIIVTPGQSQQALARHLRTQPSRVVVLVDELENRGLIERLPNSQDRRLHALHLTAKGQKLLQQIGRIAMQHEDEMCAPLDDKERRQLRELLERLRVHHGLTAGVHPGYRQLGSAKPTCRPG